MSRLWIACLAVWLAGCAQQPPVPEWQTDARAALADFEHFYLRGDAHAADAAYARARHALSATGEPLTVRRGELVRCGVTVAALDFAACPDASLSVPTGDAGLDAYAAFLSGHWRPDLAAQLPERYRPVATASHDSERLAALERLEPPLSRLVAAGALLRGGALPPEGADVAIATASAQGYRRALLAWLVFEERRSTEAGDATRAGLLRRRIDTVTGR